MPAILLVAAMDYFCISHYPGTNGETIARFTTPSFFANLAMLQAPAVTLPFGSAAPFWTVAIEFWIYMFVGLLAFAIRDGLSVPVVAGIIISGLIPLQALTDNNAVLIPWLLGALSQQLIASRSIRFVPKWVFGLVAAGSLIWLTIELSRGDRIYSNSVFFACAVAFAASLAL